MPSLLRGILGGLALGAGVMGAAPPAHGADRGPRLHPPRFTLKGQAASQRLLVTAEREGRDADFTRLARFTSSAPHVAAVSAEGLVTPLSDGAAIITAELEGKVVTAHVDVTHAAAPLPVSFELDVQPILTARGCTAGDCHGKARGQNGFQLSLLGFDPEFDYATLAIDARGRRVFPTAPDSSLLLLKGSGRLPHGGGDRLPHGGSDYNTLYRWIAAGMPRRIEHEPALTSVSIEPTVRYLRPGDTQQIIVTARYSDGSSRDVTAQTAFASNESVVASVDAAGVVKAGSTPGESTIMARYMGSIATCAVAIPQAGSVPDAYYQKLPRRNAIDEHVYRKLQSLGIGVSAPADEAKVMRRLHLDIIGRLPTAAEARAYLTSTDKDRRRKLIDALLQRPEYADHWANKWADLLRPNAYRVGIKSVLNYDQWIRDAFRANKPYDQFVRELVAAQGSTWKNGATVMFRDRRAPDEQTVLISQLFLGIRLDCARCHHHPFERWSQEDFYSFAAYFARVGYKGTGLSPPISGSEEVVFTARTKAQLKHPATGKMVGPRPLFGKAGEVTDDADPRDVIAAWMTSDDNPYFAQVIVNRIWADLMGRGIVDPVDDLRATNPPTNAALLDALAAELRRHRYDLKKLIAFICNSHIYALSSVPGDRNAADLRNYSRHYRTRLRAEVLLDAIADITGVPEQFAAMPPGSRSSQIWTHRVQQVFLDTFGRPDPNQDPPCERLPESTVTQALHLMNSPQLLEKIGGPAGRGAAWAGANFSPDALTEELYLTIYSRMPGAAERKLVREIIEKAGDDRRAAIDDLMWAMINTPEFVFKD